MRRYVVADLAIQDIEVIWDYVAEDSIHQADRLADSIYEEIRRVWSSPGIGHRRTDIGSERPLLFWAVSRYLIVYRTSSEETVILAVLHGNRDIPAVLSERDADE
jgi:plasmid stabilization system protein ParE